MLINNYFLTQFLKLNVDVFISELIIGLSIGGGGLLLVVLILLLVIKAWYVSNKYIFYTSYFPYNGQNGSRSCKSNGKANEFAYNFFIICKDLNQR